MKRSGDTDSTHPCQSPTLTVKGRDLTPDTDTNFWVGIQWLYGQQQAAVNTVLTQHSQ